MNIWLDFKLKFIHRKFVVRFGSIVERNRRCSLQIPRRRSGWYRIFAPVPGINVGDARFWLGVIISGPQIYSQNIFICFRLKPSWIERMMNWHVDGSGWGSWSRPMLLCWIVEPRFAAKSLNSAKNRAGALGIKKVIDTSGFPPPLQSSL